MKRSKFLSLPVSLLIALIIAVSSAGVALATSYFYDFSSGLSPWTGGKDPNVIAYSVGTSRFDNGTCQSPIDSFALLTLSGRSDDVSGIWMQASFPGGIAEVSHVKVSWEAKDKGNCSLCKVLIYIGGTTPTNTSQFTSMGAAPSNWTGYSYSADLVRADPIYVALGFTDTGTTLPASLGIDCVKVDITP